MQPKEVESYVDAAAAALGLPLLAEHRPGVLHYFALAAALAEQVMALPLDRDDEPATVFVPIAPIAASADTLPTSSR